MIKDVSYYRRKFSPRPPSDTFGLNVNTKGGVQSPHKPILLLSVIELIRRGQIQRNRIELSPELSSKFKKLWKDLEIPTQHKCNINVPFHGKKILLPNNKQCYLRIEALTWHRQTFLEKAG